MSEKVAKYIETDKLFLEEKIPFSNDTFNTLISSGYLTTKTPNEEYEYVAGLSNIFHRVRKASQKNFMFLVAYDCNFCGAQVGMYIFDPFGEIYGCWNTVGDSNEVLGRYDNNILEWTQNLDLWLNKNIGNSPICGKCKYALFCQRGCLSKAQIYNNDYKIPYCDEYHHTFKTVLNTLSKTYITQ